MSPKLRIKAYKYAIKDVLNWPDMPYMCPTLTCYGRGYDIDEFKEFCLFEPNGLGRSAMVWLNKDSEGNAARINILLFCIEMAKDKI